MDICTFWFGDELRLVDRLCLSSMVMTGQHVKLFSHKPVKNVPKGVELCDAEPILPLSVLYQLDAKFPDYKPNRTIVQFSDIFRVMLMKYQQGVWLDTDVYLVKPFQPDENKVWLASENRNRVGVSALYFQPNNPIINAFENYLEKKDPVPEWLGFKRRVWTPLRLRLNNEEVLPGKLGITIFGNDGISRLAKRYGFFNEAMPKETFYYWTGRNAERIFDPAYGLEPLNDERFIGFHIHKKAKTVNIPQKGSFYDWAVNRIVDFKDFQ